MYHSHGQNLNTFYVFLLSLQIIKGGGHLVRVAWYCNGSGPDWWPKKSQDRLRVGLCQVTTLGKLFTHMCLCSPSSKIWYRSKGGDAPRLGR